MMHRSLAARRHDIISYFSSSSSSVRKVFSPNSKLFSSHTSKDDLEKVINILSNSDPNERGHQIYSSLDTLLLDLTTLDKNNFAHKVIETSCETKLVKTPRVPHADLIRFIKLVWKTNNKDLITTPVVESLVSSICYSAVPTPTKKNDILFLWDFLKHIAAYHPPGLLNARILNTLIRSFSIMDPGQGKAALQVFHNFEAFQCVPNQDTYYFTLHSLSTTKSCSDDMIHQAASICQNMLLLFPNDTTPPDDDDHHHEQDIIASGHFFKIVSDDFRTALSFLGGIPPLYFRGCVCADLNLTDFNPMRQHLHHFILKTIETSCQTILIETRKVSSPHNLIHFVKWAWRRSNNNKYLITTPVLESLVSATCDGSTYLYDFSPRKNNIRFLWDLLKHIGHRQSGLLNTRILNQLIYSFGFMLNHRKTALEVFHKFEVFQCVPNRDTYTFTLKALWSARRSTDISHQAASICQKMSLHPETLLPDDGELLGNILSWFSQNNMTEEAYALYLAAKKKQKTNLDWSLQLNMLVSLDRNRIIELCPKKETVHLALKMLNDIPGELEHREVWVIQTLLRHVLRAFCGFKDFDAAKQLILKMIADGQKRHSLIYAIKILIPAYVKAGEIIQALEMVMLLDSKGLYICEPCVYGFTHANGMLYISNLLEEAKKKDSKSIVALLYHTLIVGYCKLQKFDDALKLLTQMKDFGVSDTNLDEYHNLIHSLCLTAMDRKMAIEQLDEMEPVDRKMVEKQLYRMARLDFNMAQEKLEETYLNIRALF